MANDKVKQKMEAYEKGFNDLRARRLAIGEQIEKLQDEARGIELKQAELQGRFQELREMIEDPNPITLPHKDATPEATKE